MCIYVYVHVDVHVDLYVYVYVYVSMCMCMCMSVYVSASAFASASASVCLFVCIRTHLAQQLLPLEYRSFRKLGVPYLGGPIIRILLFRVLY